MAVEGDEGVAGDGAGERAIGAGALHSTIPRNQSKLRCMGFGFDYLGHHERTFFSLSLTILFPPE